jgi:uncharacterized protein (DUF1697 family)
VTRWVALLRGVNVGGGNKLPMAELRETLRSLGHTNVQTYIQSGNVVFESAVTDEQTVSDGIRKAITGCHALKVPVVVRTHDQLVAIARRHPDADGAVEPKFLHVQFLSAVPDPLTVAALNPDAYLPDRWSIHGREIYLTCPNGSGRSKLTIEVFERAFGVTATARNLNTVRVLAEMH